MIVADLLGAKFCRLRRRRRACNLLLEGSRGGLNDLRDVETVLISAAEEVLGACVLLSERVGLSVDKHFAALSAH